MTRLKGDKKYKSILAQPNKFCLIATPLCTSVYLCFDIA